MSNNSHTEFVAETPYIKEWDFERNESLDPTSISTSSKQKANWICKKCGGRYSTSISLKTKRGIKCPYCTGNRALPGFNDLLTKLFTSL